MNEQFSVGSSYFHRLDPRVKIIASFALTLPLSLTNQHVVAVFGLTFSLIFLLISRINPLPVVKRLMAVNTFTLFLWLTLPLTYGGPAWSTIGPLALSAEGLRLAMLITLKTNAIVLIIISLPATSTISALGHGLYKLHLPVKLCYLLLYSYRYIFVIHQEYKRLLRAAKMRSFSPTTSIHTYRTFGYLFGMTVIQSWNHSRRVNDAMVLRGFTGRLISLDHSQLRKGDYYFLSSVLVLLVFLILTDCLYSNTISNHFLHTI